MTAKDTPDAHPAPDAATVVPPVHTPAEPLPQGWVRREDHLVWLDLEMTGLEPATDRIIEIAVIVTDAQLNVRVTGPVFAVHQSDALLDTMDAWNRGTHGKSGLTQRVRASTYSEEEVEAQVLEWLRTVVPAGKSPLCGNTIGQDRRFLNRYMPRLENFFHYRNIDVSTLKELAKRWKPAILPGFAKAQKHTALADIHESIDEMIYYRQHFLDAPQIEAAAAAPAAAGPVSGG